MVQNEIEIFTPSFIQDPYSTFQQLRDSYPILPYEYEGEKYHVISRYKDVRYILKNLDFGRSNQKRTNPAYQSLSDLLGNWILFTDPPDHTRIRKLLKEEHHHLYRGLEETVQSCSKRLTGEIKKEHKVDVISKYATMLPVLVMFEMLGIPDHDYKKIINWGKTLSEVIDLKFKDEEVYLSGTETANKIQSYLIEKVNQKDYRKGSMFEKLASYYKRGVINQNEFTGTASMLIFTGFETMISLIGNGIYLLYSHPEQLELILRDPEKINIAVEEILRFESPIQLSFRFCLKDLNYNNIQMKKGDELALFIGSANHDPAYFPDPDVFDINRKKNNHLAFGTGIHLCYGNSIARLQAKIALTEFIQSFPGATLADEKPVWRNNKIFRKLKNLDINLGN